MTDIPEKLKKTVIEPIQKFADVKPQIPVLDLNVGSRFVWLDYTQLLVTGDWVYKGTAISTQKENLLQFLNACSSMPAKVELIGDGEVIECTISNVVWGLTFASAASAAEVANGNEFYRYVEDNNLSPVTMPNTYNLLVVICDSDSTGPGHFIVVGLDDSQELKSYAT